MDTAAPIQNFSAAMLPARDRMAIWREVFGREVVQLDMAPIDDGPFRYDAAFRRIGQVTLGAGAVSAIRCARTPELVRDGNDDILILLPLEGAIRVVQRDVDMTLPRGAALVRRSEDPGHTLTSAGRYLTITLPEAALTRRLTDADRLTLSVIPDGAEGLTLLRHYALMLLAPSTAGTTGPGDTQLAARHLADLASLAIGAAREGWILADERGGDAARLSRIEAEIATGATDPDFTLDTVARRLRLSPGHVRKLLARDGRSFSARVRARRLAVAAEALRDPRRRAEPISAIAYGAGFSDISYFNRAFRAAYGTSPSGLRAGAT